MMHTLWTMAPYIAYLIGAGSVIGGLAWWACNRFEETDEWLFGVEARDEVLHD